LSALSGTCLLRRLGVCAHASEPSSGEGQRLLSQVTQFTVKQLGATAEGELSERTATRKVHAREKPPDPTST
jgi:hypothetical protein